MIQRVLIVDDTKNIHALVKARLNGEPVELHSCFSSADGLAMAGTLLPDLILLDVDMPDMDGFEVCRRLKGHPATMNIPVVFLTGAGSTDEKIRGLELGAVDYVTKPFEPAELRARVRAALRIVAACMQATCRIEDVVCRYGGEEFGIIVPNTPSDKALIMADRLRKNIEKLPLQHRGVPVQITCSFGIADVTSCGEKDIIAAADAALYRAKDAGRNRIEIAPPVMSLAKAS